MFHVGRAGAVVGAQGPAVRGGVVRAGAARDRHGLDREHHAVPQRHPPSRPALVRHARVLVHTASDAVAAEVLHDAVPPARHTVPIACAMSPMRLPTTAASMPAASARSAVPIGVTSAGRGAPTVKLIAESPAQPPSWAPQSIETRSPSRSR
ncbi:hypothetical protein ADK41_05830 [Streptomyces caelestis]|uniref:Uncharacterized protein n=1 Tax=Streptomyces caelestis TaxID=36816 RepID=A0A0M8QMS0_9ACTN|nr:hypothetical protein ADK41_05830 [Streptomyces caelestis]